MKGWVIAVIAPITEAQAQKKSGFETTGRYPTEADAIRRGERLGQASLF